ncbi:MAG: hypothetical protein RBT38_08475 [Bacteroidales bacterium]|jgi:hypothetical protein|nr:hypothetical protein [Bacteroidales bacterium]
MKKLAFIAFLMLLYSPVEAQVATGMQKYLSSEENLQAIATLGPYSTGGLGFDNRYEGIKGTPRLLDTLVPASLRIARQAYFIRMDADLDLVQNYVIYMHPVSRKMFSVPIDAINEVIININGNDVLFRSTSGLVFEKDLKEQKFYQVLKEGSYRLIKIPFKQFVAADYKNAYSADRRYDEYVPMNKYYLKGPDSIYHQIQLSKKSVLKIYPGRKDIAGRKDDENTSDDKEAAIVSFLDKI